MKLTDALSWLGHAALASAIAGVLYGLLRVLGVQNAQWIAIGFPAGMYYGREILDQYRNIYEELKATGIGSEEARAQAQGWRYALFYGWHLDGILDVVFPWTALVTLAVLASIFL